MKIVLSSFVFAIIAIFVITPLAFAHVIVHPSQVGVASFQEFTMSVPTEKSTPTVVIRLLIPKGVQSVMPNVKPGWTITEKKEGDTVIEIDWTGGSIPPEQRDDFIFQAQVPSSTQVLKWKAYQTYGDGTIVSWDHMPSANPNDDSAPPPYSMTSVINDLKNTSPQSTATNNGTFEVISILAFLMGGIALFLEVRGRK